MVLTGGDPSSIIADGGTASAGNALQPKRRTGPVGELHPSPRIRPFTITISVALGANATVRTHRQLAVSAAKRQQLGWSKCDRIIRLRSGTYRPAICPCPAAGEKGARLVKRDMIALGIGEREKRQRSPRRHIPKVDASIMGAGGEQTTVGVNRSGQEACRHSVGVVEKCPKIAPVADAPDPKLSALPRYRAGQPCSARVE